ncbi:hypothetical protein EDD16DRAFT_1796190 [Pisolithus croceorrhizus]|nr:hypothetical protein EDD16DRAFT_1796190 [Pisolithus croceorrhizus]
MFNYLATKFQDPTPISIPTEKPIEASSDDETQEPCAKPNELSVELPSEERLEDRLTEARSNDEAEVADGVAQQTPSRSIEFEEYVPDVPSKLHAAQSKLYKQPSSRAGKPLKSEHLEVLNGMVKVPDEVENVDKVAHEDLPWKPCDRSTTNDLPSTRELPLEGEQALCTSADATNGQNRYTKEPQLTIYNPSGTLEWPAASFRKAETDESERRGTKGHYMDANNAKHGGSLEGEKIDCASDSAGRSASSDQTNLRGREGLAATTVESTMPWRRVGIGNINKPSTRNMAIEAPSSTDPETTFGRPASPNEGRVLSRADGNKAEGNREPRDEKSNTTSSCDVDSKQIEAALLARECQGAYRSQDKQGNSPVSSRQLTTTRERSYEAIKPRRRRGRIKFEAGNISRVRKGENTFQGHGNTILHAREGIGMSRNLSTKNTTLEEWPEGVKKWRSVNTNASGRIRGPADQGEVNGMLGVVKGVGKCLSNRKRVEMDGRKCQKDGTTSSIRCGSKRAKTMLLAEDEAGQHQRQQHKLEDVPGPPKRLRKHTYEPTRPRCRRGRIKTESRKVSRLQESERMHRGRDNAIARPREGIGTLRCLTVKSRARWKCRRRVSDDAGSAQAMRSTRRRYASTGATRPTKSGNYTHVLYEVPHSRFETEQNHYHTK